LRNAVANAYHKPYAHCNSYGDSDSDSDSYGNCHCDSDSSI